MNIEQLFKKDITRDIEGVIKIGQQEKENINKELEEYVVTGELADHFKTFYESYLKAYEKPTDKVGVWISGFFGSGKSHFLKILSYLLQSDIVINGKRPVDYFKDKIQDQGLLDEMEKAAEHPSEVVLFNIDSKAESGSKQDETAIVNVFNKVFNERRGYSASIPWLADLEETLDNNGDYETFQEHFEEETGLSWKEGREELFYNYEETITALSKATEITEEVADRWLENAEENYSISVDSFAQRINNYVEQKDDDFRLIFAVDEVGQYISGSTQLMLNLQTVVEDLGKYSNGKAWVMVTSQQEIASLRDELSSTDYSKIQGRFNTRISLSSANADEVIKIRLLDKKAEPFAKLTAIYDEHEVALKNKLEFEEAATMKFFRDKEDFARVYPFIPYQFNLLQKVFTGIREHGSSGKHLSDGERNLLESIQQATIQYKSQDLNTLIPFQTFYESIDQALEHSVRSTIINASQNEALSSFDVDVLKLLFLIRYVDEMPGTLKNLTTLMISSIDEDMIELSKRINESLQLLIKEFLIQRIGNKYLFLTNEEQDVNREIGNIQIPTSEIVNEAGRRIVDDILQLKRHTYRPFKDNSKVEYLFVISQWMDDRAIKNASAPLGVRFLTAYSDHTEEAEVISLSQRETKVIAKLPEDTFDDLTYYLKINQYLRTQSAKAKTPTVQEIQNRKVSERGQIENIFMGKLKQLVGEAQLYVNGSPIEASGSPLKRIEQGLDNLVTTNYPKINYVRKNYSKEAIENLIYSKQTSLLEEQEDENNQATNEINRYLERQNNLNVTVTLYEIIERYSKEPYGWLELDIIGSLLRLMRAEQITFTLNNRKMSSQENDFYKNITKKNMQEKIIVTKRKVLDKKIVNEVRQLMKELFAVSSIGDKEEEIVETVTDKFSTEYKRLERIREYYKRGQYPDKELVREAIDEIDKLLSIKDSSEQLTYFAKEGDIFVELFEDLEDVIDFFSTNYSTKTSMKDIYDKAVEKSELYENDQNYLDNEELSFIVEQINETLNMQRPYRKIKDLQGWIKRFNLELTQELENQTDPIQDAIEQDKRDIEKELNDLKTYPEYDRIKNSYDFKIKHLDQSLTRVDTVRALQSLQQESREIKTTILNKIIGAKRDIAKRQKEEEERSKKEQASEISEDYPEKNEKKPSSSTESIETKTEIKSEIPFIIGREQILPTQLVELRTEKDIEEYINAIKEKLQNELDKADVIKIY